jgi:hypothetical protein
VLASFDKYIEAGEHRSKRYGIEFDLPIKQLISVRCLPAPDLFGQVISEGTIGTDDYVDSILLPLLLQCNGKIDLTAGPLELGFTLFDTDDSIGEMHIWSRTDNTVSWKLHKSPELMKHVDTSDRISQQVTTKISHFTEFAFGVKPKLNAFYLHGDIINYIAKSEKKKFPCKDGKFIGNLTEREVRAIATPASFAQSGNENRSRGWRFGPKISVDKVAAEAGDISKGKQAAVNMRYYECSPAYVMPKCVTPLPDIISDTEPYRIPSESVYPEKPKVAAYVHLFCQKTDTSPWDIYEEISLSPGSIVILCPPRLDAVAAHGQVTLFNPSDSLIDSVRKKVGWLKDYGTPPAPTSAAPISLMLTTASPPAAAIPTVATQLPAGAPTTTSTVTPPLTDGNVAIANVTQLTSAATTLSSPTRKESSTASWTQTLMRDHGSVIAISAVSAIMGAAIMLFLLYIFLKWTNYTM